MDTLKNKSDLAEGTTSEILLRMVDLLSQLSEEKINKVWAGWQEMLDHDQKRGLDNLREVLELIVKNAIQIKRKETV